MYTIRDLLMKECTNRSISLLTDAEVCIVSPRASVSIHNSIVIDTKKTNFMRNKTGFLKICLSVSFRSYFNETDIVRSRLVLSAYLRSGTNRESLGVTCVNIDAIYSL